MKHAKDKKSARIRRATKHKAKLQTSTRPILVVFRSNVHIYAQAVVAGPNGREVLAAASTIDKTLKTSLAKTKIEQATQVGKLLGERLKAKNITDLSFDRSGYKYHGRVKALADAAREEGLNF